MLVAMGRRHQVVSGLKVRPSRDFLSQSFRDQQRRLYPSRTEGRWGRETFENNKKKCVSFLWRPCRFFNQSFSLKQTHQQLCIWAYMGHSEALAFDLQGMSRVHSECTPSPKKESQSS